MIFRNLDENGDFTFGNGIGNYLRDDAAISMNIKTRIQSWVGDCFFDLGAGIDWINRLGSKGQRELLELDLKRIILQSYGVTGIMALDIELNGRDFVANYSITTIFSRQYSDTVEIGNG